MIERAKEACGGWRRPTSRCCRRAEQKRDDILPQESTAARQRLQPAAPARCSAARCSGRRAAALHAAAAAEPRTRCPPSLARNASCTLPYPVTATPAGCQARGTALPRLTALNTHTYNTWERWSGLRPRAVTFDIIRFVVSTLIGTMTGAYRPGNCATAR